MVRRILWAITGSGSFLRDLVQLFIKLREEFGSRVEVAVALSSAGEEVARIYGVLDMLSRVASNTRYGGIYRDSSSSSGYPLAGRVGAGKYDLVVIAPATSNTVAKVVCGIADTLPTIAASQALKSRTPLIILPSDYSEESVTQLPCRIEVSKCTSCGECLKEGFCPYHAVIAAADAYPLIDYSKCRGCGVCILRCPASAFVCWEEVVVRASKIDLENVAKLESIEGVKVVKSLKELEEVIRYFIVARA